MTRNLYKILEVDENASIDDIKKSYKKLALIHHPDKNKDKPDAEAKFKEISNAYSILSNPETKEKYDHLGDERFNNDSGGGPDMPNMDDLFQHLFGGRRANPFGNPFGNPFEQHDNSNQCGHVMKSYNITLEDIYNGINKNIKINIKKYCKKCNTTCSKCNGLGVVQQFMQMGPMTQIIQTNCHNCEGSGIANKRNSKCDECKGNGVYEVENIVNLIMPKGFDTNHTVFNGYGEQPKNNKQKPGNLILQFTLCDHKLFIKNGNDLIYKYTLTLTESIVGKSIVIEYFDEQIKINTNQFGIINPSKQYIIKNRGLPIANTNKKGNMIIEFSITYPKLNNESIPELTEMLNKSFVY
uniref:J domain-containing protein n=1 Tax=viral metagenome TaxID=1070528 RepID=A0A6C0DPF0_9ZZZZ